MELGLEDEDMYCLYFRGARLELAFVEAQCGVNKACGSSGMAIFLDWNRWQTKFVRYGMWWTNVVPKGKSVNTKIKILKKCYFFFELYPLHDRWKGPVTL